MKYPEVFEFKWKKPWKNLLIFGAIHWNEVCWPQVLWDIIEKIKSWNIVIESGSLTLIPVCNEEAYSKNVRQINENLNRIFWKNDDSTYERKLANFLKKEIDKADYLLDLHSFDGEWNPFMFEDYDDQKTIDFVKAIWCEYLVKWWTEMYPDDEWLDTVSYAHKAWKIWALVECWNHEEESCFGVWMDSCLNAMKYLGLISWKLEEKSSIYLKLSKLYYKEKEGKFSGEYIQMQEVKKGEIIAKYSDGAEIKAEKNGNILFPKTYANIWEEWFYLCYKD